MSTCTHHACSYIFKGIVPVVNCISEYAVRVSSRIVAQIQDRVSTGWKWQLRAVPLFSTGHVAHT